MIARLLVLVTLAALASGCASRAARCLSTDRDYQQAESLPPLQSTPGLKLPESPSALRIPPEPTQTAALPEGQCLEAPPRLQEKPEAPAPAAPAAATPPPPPAAPAPTPPAPEAKP